MSDCLLERLERGREIVMTRIFIVLCIILITYKAIKYIRYKVIERKINMRGRRKCKGHYGLIQLEGNMTCPIPGDFSKTTMVFWYDPKEVQKIFSDKL